MLVLGTVTRAEPGPPSTRRTNLAPTFGFPGRAGTQRSWCLDAVNEDNLHPCPDASGSAGVCESRLKHPESGLAGVRAPRTLRTKLSAFVNGHWRVNVILALITLLEGTLTQGKGVITKAFY